MPTPKPKQRIRYPLIGRNGKTRQVTSNQLPRVVVYQDLADEWRWKKFAPNGHNVSNGSEGYTRRSDAANMAVDQVTPFLLVLQDRQGNVEQRKVVTTARGRAS